MDTQNKTKTLIALTVATMLVTMPAYAQTDSERIGELEGRVSALADQLSALSAELAEAKAGLSGPEAGSVASEMAVARQESRQALKAASEWKDATSVTHISGYASADYVSPENGPSAFNANFNPMFHFLYGNKILWEAELEVEVEENGATEIGLEYSTVDVFLNNNLTLVAGKFLSPIGNFRQNLHPSWINKLPSAPPGFGHDGAAPIADVGAQLRGVAVLGQGSKLLYTGYIGNGPKIEGEDGEIHAVESDGFAGDADDKKLYGGRIAFLPVPNLEIAVSAAFGDVAVVEDDGMDVENDPTRNYTVTGFDASYRQGNLELRGEYVNQDIDAQDLSVAPEGAKWKTWYAQGAYKFGAGKWEGVLRFTDFTSPHADDSQEQWAFGLNYLLTPSAMFKFGFESNSGLPGEHTDEDRWIAQLAYGY